MPPKRSNAGRDNVGCDDAGHGIRGPFRRRSTHRQILHEVGERILRGVFLPGDIMPSETALADELQVSRPILREAIKVLAAKGLVDSRPKIGTRVKPRKDWNMLDPDILAWSFASPDAEGYAVSLSEMRRILEPAAAALAASRATPAQIERIGAAYDGMAAAEEDSQESIVNDLEFHRAILAATGNAFLVSTGPMIASALRFGFRMASRIEGARTRSLPRHAAVLETIAAHDPEAARQEMELLLDEAWADIAVLLGAEGVPANGAGTRNASVRIGKVRRKS